MTIQHKITDQLVLRSVRDQVDQVNYATFNTTYNNASEGASAACLMRYHPETVLDNYWLVEDVTTGEIVSTTCLIPWNCYFAGVDLRIAQLELVLTRPDYRGRGLVRAQINLFEQIAKARGFDLCIIWGIPYYYRQYGYSYALDGMTSETLPTERIPAQLLSGQLPLSLRPASTPDIPELTQLYDNAVSGLDVRMRRSSVYWKYLLKAAKHPIEMVENVETGELLGYVTIVREEKNTTILEHSLPGADTAAALLQTLKARSIGQIEIYWPQESPLIQVARSLGSQTKRGGQWLLRIPDVTRFLTRIAPVLEERLVASRWQYVNFELIINLFQQAFLLRFNGGMLSVTPLGFVDYSMGADGGHLCIPPDAFTRLITGYRTLDDLCDAWPDIIVKPEAHDLARILFPRMSGYLSTPSGYMG